MAYLVSAAGTARRPLTHLWASEQGLKKYCHMFGTYSLLHQSTAGEVRSRCGHPALADAPRMQGIKSKKTLSALDNEVSFTREVRIGLMCLGALTRMAL
jgi:hypothetical protein